MAEPARELGTLQVVDDADRLGVLLPPLRRRLLALLARPASASELARRLGISRQKINYHLRQLEEEGLIELVETRRRRGCLERRLRATARAYVVSSTVLGDLAPDPERLRDRFSSAYLVAVAARLIQDVGVLRERAGQLDQRLATATLETEVHVASPAELRSFIEELATEIARLTDKYTRPSAPSSRPYRFVLGAHPKVTKSAEDAAEEAARHGADRAADSAGGATAATRSEVREGPDGSTEPDNPEEET